MAVWPSWGGRHLLCPGRRASQHSPTDPVRFPLSEVKPRVFVAGYLPSTHEGS
ncbi:hypothetical protein BT67DRAFT_445153 [Trichocladium antarcticum]|uniref:Uncharacterized protein n=1 Tax=Trichocladium antarcticum TaxID=1450529 RepID=A0AAN6UE60_9PEZI|nr:hypothetical protein BT67DRAFT_445153 [Trichocladium antarcticum]